MEIGREKKEMPGDAVKLQEGEDYYFNEEGLMVFTSAYLLKRGYCCKNKCRNCPYNKWDNDPAANA
ncbi:MAG: DUF5522 domain-containing protein [Bacteroidota bacterium]|nr:DUF5522 domain-containing protein [Bacteroidota bacterium]